MNTAKRVSFMEHAVFRTIDAGRVIMRLISLRIGSCFNELNSVLKNQNGFYISAGLSASFSRADDYVLPTGRIFYSKDVVEIPLPFHITLAKLSLKTLKTLLL